MIPATHFHDNQDGTMWWVLGPWTQDSDPPVKQLDRPCDTCDGRGVIDRIHDGQWSEPCPGCHGTGRHVFEIEVERECDECDNGIAYGPEWEDWDRRMPMTCETCGGKPRTLLVHVVPDMVLPIVDNGVGRFRPFIQADPDGTRFWLFTDPLSIKSVTLPPAAKPGMWAVKLEVHR